MRSPSSSRRRSARPCRRSAGGGAPSRPRRGPREGGESQAAAQTAKAFFTGGGDAREHAEYALADVVLRPPVLHPPSVRDFMAFEEHVANARKLRGAEVPREWYEIPVFYFSNPTAIYGPGDAVPYPDGTQELDYELECAAIIAARGAIGGCKRG